MTQDQTHSAQACYLQESASSLLFGNSQVEIQIDRNNGTLTGLLNRTTGVQFLGNGKPDIFRMQYATYGSHGATSEDAWSAGYGSQIYGSKQRVSGWQYKETATGATLEVAYEGLDLGRRVIPIRVTYAIELYNGREETLWRMTIDNQDSGTIREVSFPILAGLAELDQLLMPNHGGERLLSPLGQLSDETPRVYLEYPARASMQWFEYASRQAGLYMASYDQSMAYTRMVFGRQGEGDDAAMWLVKYPFAVAGTRWESPHLAVGIHAGDWHRGADLYREWLESWVPKPRPAKRVAEMVAENRGIWIKGRDGRTIHTYEDVVHVSQQVGTGASVWLIGWFYNGHDTYFPEYNAIPELGGDQALVAAVDGAHQRGVFVDAYMNGRICNNETETYRKQGKKWAVLGSAPGLGVASIDFFELHEGWNKEWERAEKSEGWFSVMCPSAKGWQDHIVGQVIHGLQDYHFDGIFVDQPGSYYAQLCYNRHHGHDTPASAWGPGLLEIFRRIHREAKAIDPQFVIWTEGMNDVYGQYLDYHTDKNPLWEPMRVHPEAGTFVEMWRYTLPWYITENPSPYSYPPSQDPVYGYYYHFLLGIRGLSAAGRGQEGSPGERRARRAVIKRIETLWRKGGEFFTHGQFVDDVGLEVSDPGILAKAYTADSAVAIPVWNTTGDTLACDVHVDLDAMCQAGFQVSQATSLEDDRNIPYDALGGEIHIHLQLPPHGISIVVLR